jgi:hypothetical protein
LGAGAEMFLAGVGHAASPDLALFFGWPVACGL